MPRKKKLTEAETKLKKKEYDRRRREKLKNDPESLEKLREKERLKYLKKKEKGQVKCVSIMSSRERRLKRKNWKNNSQTYRDKKVKLRKNVSRILNYTPPSSPGPSNPGPSSPGHFQAAIQNTNERRDLIAAQRRRQLRKRRAVMYSKIASLKKKLQDEIRKREKYRRRCLRQTKISLTSPEAKVSALLKNVKVPATVKKKLIFSEVITKQLQKSYSNLKKHSDKKKYFEILKPDLLKKNKVLHLSKPFFKHDTYKKSGCRKLNSKLMIVKTDVTDFLELDENSRMCPGKKDFIRSKGLVKQKRLLCDTMKNLHSKFLTTVKYKVSLSTFCKLRPFWVTWANIKDRDTCKCVIHANVQLMVMKLHEYKALSSCNLTRFLANITCDVHSPKCLLGECKNCKHKSVEYYLPLPKKKVTYHQWMYETITYEKDGKTKTVRKPVKKEIKVFIKELVQNLEETLPSFYQHVATICHQYQTISELKKNLTQNEVLIHIDFSENYSCKYNEEIQAVHFGGARQQVTLHTGVLYLRRDEHVVPKTFCSLSDNSRHDTMAVWAHLKPILEWIKSQDINIHRIHMLSDSPVNQYKNKFMFHIVSRHINDLFSGITFFSWNYSEPGHGKGAPDGVGGTLKRTADKAVAEGQDIVDLHALKNILLTRCPSIMLFEVNTADITAIETLVKQTQTIAAFRGTQKIRQFVLNDNILEFRKLSCFACVEKCSHFHLGYYSSSGNYSITTRKRKVSIKTEPSDSDVAKRHSRVPTQTETNGGWSSKDCPSTENNAPPTNKKYELGDYVLIKWNECIYPGEITSVSEEAALVKCMKRGAKFWKWPVRLDEELYGWQDILQKIEPPTLIKSGCYHVKEMDIK